MAGHDKGAHSDEHDGGRKENASLIGGKDSAAVLAFVNESLGDKNAVVIALSENECGENHVDEVEFDVEQVHRTQNPQPRHGHGKEGDEGMFELSER